MKTARESGITFQRYKRLKSVAVAVGRPAAHATLHTANYPDFNTFYFSENRTLGLLWEPRFSQKTRRNGSEQSGRKSRAVSSAEAGAKGRQRCTCHGRTKRRTWTKF